MSLFSRQCAKLGEDRLERFNARVSRGTSQTCHSAADLLDSNELVLTCSPADYMAEPGDRDFDERPQFRRELFCACHESGRLKRSNAGRLLSPWLCALRISCQTMTSPGPHTGARSSHG